MIGFSRCPASDLRPLSASPLREIRCRDCVIDSLEALRQVTSLRTLDVRRSRIKIKSLEPLRGLSLHDLCIESTGISDLRPICKAPIVALGCSDCDLASLAPLHSLPLRYLGCSRNRIDSLEALRGMKLRELECSRNRITSLEPLRGMPLDSLEVCDNPLTTLEPLVESPPKKFLFDCPSLPDAELTRVRDLWQARPESRHHARNAEAPWPSAIGTWPL